MASIFQRGNTWWIHYRVGGKSVARSLKTPLERVAVEHKQRIEAMVLTDQLPVPSKCPIKEVVQAFVEYMLNTRTRKSAKNEVSYLRSFFGPCCPALEMGSHVPKKFRDQKRELPRIPDPKKKTYLPVTKLEQISREMVAEFLRRRAIEEHVGAKTINRQRGVLHRLFTYAAEHHDYICPDRRFRNPVAGVKPMREAAPEIEWLTREQIDQQLSVLGEHPVIHALVATYIYAGLRREEALWLTRDDVDMERRLIRVTAKTIEGEFWQPKTRRNRVVPMSQALLTILARYTPPHAGPWYFPSPAGARWHPDNFSQDLHALNAQHGLSWACLTFRHTFGSHLAQKGESLFKIATLMGNSPEICRRHYAALVPEAMHDTVEFDRPQTEAPRLAPAASPPAAPRLRLVY